MVLYPDVQAKAQAEIDSAVGRERLPGFNDRDSLPYVDALCKEVLRWHSIGPLGTDSYYCDVLDQAHQTKTKSNATRRHGRYPLWQVHHPQRNVHYRELVVSIVLTSHTYLNY